MAPRRLFGVMMNAKFIKDMQRWMANTSIGASTARRMGPKKTVEKARTFLKGLRLKRFLKKTESAFVKELDKVTEELMEALPHKAGKWGSARKFLNIFLRGCTYNKYLCTHYKLGQLEKWLEVPLDKDVAINLKCEAGRGMLPRWYGVIHLTPAESDIFQWFASGLADAKRVNRVDLDIEFWRSGNKQ